MHLRDFFIFITGHSKVLGIKRFIFEIPTFVTALLVLINHEERAFTAWLTATEETTQITLKVSCFQSLANSATQLDLLVKQNYFCLFYFRTKATKSELLTGHIRTVL